ncbi:glycosyltransferase family 4 protein [Thalassospira marina]|nr:glycosyltransferase [Thalassospira marina]
MKIALISNLIPPYRYSSHQLLAKMVEDTGGAFRIFRTHKTEPQRSWPDPSGRFSQIILPGFHIPLGENRSLALTRSPASHLAHFAPDIVLIAGFGPAMWLAHKWCRARNIPYIVRFDGWAASDGAFKNPIRRKMRRDILAHAHAGIAAGTPGADWFIDHGVAADQVSIIPIAPSFHPPSNLPASTSRPHDLLWCGRPTDAKGFDHFLILAAKLWQSGVVKSIAIAGIGPADFKTVQAKINQAGIGEITTLIPAVPADQLAPIYGRAKLFCLPSRSDAYGVAVIDAISCQTVSLASDQTGCAHDMLVPGETMLPLPSSLAGYDAWVNAATKLLSTPDYYAHHLARQTAAITGNDPENIARQTLVACQKVLLMRA